MTRNPALAEILSYQSEVRKAEHDLRHTVALAKMNGATWTEIGAQLGITKQAAQQKYADAKPNTYTCNCGWTQVVRLSPEDCKADSAIILEHVGTHTGSIFIDPLEGK